MVSVKKEAGIFINPHSNKDIQDRVLKRIIPRVNAGFYSPGEQNESLPGKIIVIGGEGTIRDVIQDMVDKDDVTPLGIVAGGTNNVLYRTLLANGNSMGLSDFMEYDTDELARRFSFRPGLFEQSAFTNQVGLGIFEQSQGTSNEKLRGVLRGKLPGRSRLFAASFKALLTALTQGSDTLAELDLYSLTPFVGSKKLFPDQDPNGDLITHAHILGNSKTQRMRYLTIVAASWALGKIPPPNTLEMEQDYSFTADISHSPAIWLDGDTKPLHSEKREVVITRWNKAIPVVAITYV